MRDQATNMFVSSSSCAKDSDDIRHDPNDITHRGMLQNAHNIIFLYGKISYSLCIDIRNPLAEFVSHSNFSFALFALLHKV